MANVRLAISGGSFSEVARKAKEVANRVKLVEFEFNGVLCLVNRDTNLDLLWRDYHNAWTMEWKQVGPDCLENYEPEVAEELRKRQVLAEEKSEQQRKEYKIEEDKERAVFVEKVKGVEIELSDVDGWNKFKEVNKDPYGACCVEYAEGWAKLMQAEFANGKKIADCAATTSHELGFLGITGFMYGCAVSMLAKCWKHGEALRLWHNLDTQFGTEGEKANESGGVLNPALMTPTTAADKAKEIYPGQVIRKSTSGFAEAMLQQEAYVRGWNEAAALLSGEDWISVDKPPDIGDEYLVVYDLEDGDEPLSTAMQFDARENKWYDERGAGAECKTVLFWMPLPEPPKP